MRELRDPWELPYTPWNTRAKFYTYLRGGLRKSLWSHNPTKTEFIKSKRVRVPLGKRNKEGIRAVVWGCKCEQCGEEKKQSDCQVDHRQGEMKLNCVEDIQRFVLDLVFISFEDLALLCKECHAVKTYSERHNLSFEEAEREKLVIAIMKDKQIKHILMTDFDYTEKQVSNEEKRKGAVRELVKLGVIK
jgi:hypothetical protein